MLDLEGQALRDELLEIFRAGVEARLDDDAFDALACRVFEYQFQRNQPYAAYCRRRGILPDSVGHWSRIPAVPTAAFKEVRLSSGGKGADAVFRTSGTTRGRERRGEHVVPDLTLYHGSLLATFWAFLLPDGAEPPILSLVPPPRDLPDSSLAHMVGVILERLGSDGSGYFASAESGLDEPALEAALERFQADGTPVCLLGTSLAFAHWMDGMRDRGASFRLPAGSRLMDTGGFKGRRREVPEDELRAAYADRLGIPTDHCINEYGMTELCSQFYDSVLRDRILGRPAGPRHKQGPPWTRTVAVHPETLEPVPAGETGILRHLDLANLGSVAAVQTEDLGRQVEGGFVVLGRIAGAAPRGCSVAMDLLLSAARERHGR